MTDIIIIVILVVIVGAGVLSIVKKSKEKSSCCGSTAYKAKEKKLSKVVSKKTFKVEGMYCQNCVNRVMEDVQDIAGASANVELKKGIVTVSMECDIADAVIVNAIEKHGYKVIE